MLDQLEDQAKKDKQINIGQVSPSKIETQTQFSHTQISAEER